MAHLHPATQPPPVKQETSLSPPQHHHEVQCFAPLASRPTALPFLCQRSWRAATMWPLGRDERHRGRVGASFGTVPRRVDQVFLPRAPRTGRKTPITGSIADRFRRREAEWPSDQVGCAWSLGDWSSCSTTCGAGVRSRAVCGRPVWRKLGWTLPGGVRWFLGEFGGFCGHSVASVLGFYLRTSWKCARMAKIVKINCAKEPAGVLA